MATPKIYALLDKPTSWGLADAMADGTAEPLEWIDVELPSLDLRVTTLRDAAKMSISYRPRTGADPITRVLRVSTTYEEQVKICRANGLVSATAEILRALWKADPEHLKPSPLVRTTQDSMLMGTLSFLIKENDELERKLAELPPDSSDLVDCGFDKCWIIDPMMITHGACNMGMIQLDGHEIQSPGGQHNKFHSDYSQWFAGICKRAAVKLSTGETVDLLEWEKKKFPSISKFLAAYD